MGKLESSIQNEYRLEENYPNPFNPSTTISFSIPNTEKVSLKIFNILGSEVSELVNKFLTSGNYSFVWNAEKQPSGVYFYQLSTDSYSELKKMILIR